MGSVAELLRALRTVLGARLATVLHALRVEHAAQHVVAYTRKIANATANLARQIATHCGDVTLENLGFPGTCPDPDGGSFTTYSVYDAEKNTWSECKKLKMPDDPSCRWNSI